MTLERNGAMTLPEHVSAAWFAGVGKYTIVHNENESNILHVSKLIASDYIEVTPDAPSHDFLVGAIYERYMNYFKIIKDLKDVQS
jgi:hypothetical protein